jgi:hypothetical protein
VLFVRVFLQPETVAAGATGVGVLFAGVTIVEVLLEVVVVIVVVLF